MVNDRTGITNRRNPDDDADSDYVQYRYGYPSNPDANSIEQTPARIGYELVFLDSFAQPTVDLAMGKQTKTHETLGGESVTQVFGRKADRLTIQGVIIAGQIEDAKGLRDADNGPFEIRTEEWSGTGVVKNVDVTPRRDRWEGNWLYDVTIDLVEETR